MSIDDSVLADPDRLVSLGGAVLAATASAGAQLRAGIAETDGEVLDAIAASGRPRAVVVMGAGGSSAAGEILAACSGRGSPVPVVSTGGPGLPGWVGPMDLVIAISASGESPETIAVVAEAGRRGCTLVGVSAGDGPLEDAVAHARGRHLHVRHVAAPRLARTLTWRLAAPVLLLGQRLGIVDGGQEVLHAAADALAEASQACGPTVELGQNPAKDLALAAAEDYLMVWGTPSVAAAAARRMARQLAENAGLPAGAGAFPEVARTHARILAGPWRDVEADIFRDRLTEPDGGIRPHLLLLTDDETDAVSAELVAASSQVASDSGIPVSTLNGGSGHPLLRFARLSQPTDLASVYAAAVAGADSAGSAAGLHPRLGSGR